MRLNGVIELGDDIYKLSGRASLQCHRRQRQLQGYDFSLSHNCPNVEVELSDNVHIERAHLTWLAASLQTTG